MSFNIDQVAKLAHIKLKPEEVEKLGKDLAGILKYVEQLKELDTENVEETCHVLDMKNVFRKDEVKPTDVRDKVLDNAPDRDGNFFRVPKVVER